MASGRTRREQATGNPARAIEGPAIHASGPGSPVGGGDSPTRRTSGENHPPPGGKAEQVEHEVGHRSAGAARGLWIGPPATAWDQPGSLLENPKGRWERNSASAPRASQRDSCKRVRSFRQRAGARSDIPTAISFAGNRYARRFLVGDVTAQPQVAHTLLTISREAPIMRAMSCLETFALDDARLPPSTSSDISRSRRATRP